MNIQQKMYKVYEIIDNVEEKLEVYPTFFVGAFLSKKKAVKLCEIIDVTNNNSTKIVYGEITYSDISDLKKHGLNCADETALLQIKQMLQAKKHNSEKDFEK